MMWKMVGEIEYSIRTGEPSGEHVFEAGTWGGLARTPEANRIFDESMTAKARSQLGGILASYDFGGAATIADIGGGRGHLLRAILDAAPAAQGVLFDQPHVVDRALPAERLLVQAGDFFTSDLPGCDIYLLMEVIHDWDDERAGLILTNVRRAAAQGARVLIIEALIPEGGTANWPLMLDLWMLNISGRQRSLDEYAALLASAGFTNTRRIDTPVGLTIVEGVAGSKKSESRKSESR